MLLYCKCCELLVNDNKAVHGTGVKEMPQSIYTVILYIETLKKLLQRTHFVQYPTSFCCLDMFTSSVHVYSIIML